MLGRAAGRERQGTPTGTLGSIVLVPGMNAQAELAAHCAFEAGAILVANAKEIERTRRALKAPRAFLDAVELGEGPIPVRRRERVKCPDTAGDQGPSRCLNLERRER